MDFYFWMDKQMNRQDNVGCLARAMSIDPCLPVGAAVSYNSLQEHLCNRHKADRSQRQALRQAWEEFTKSLS